MIQTSFELACDRLSQSVDKAQFERLRWSRVEGPMLEKLVALAQEWIGQRPDFELSEEGSASVTKRYVIKVHGFRIAGLALGLKDGLAQVQVEAVNRGRSQVAAGAPVTAAYGDVTAEWMGAALEEMFGRIGE